MFPYVSENMRFMRTALHDCVAYSAYICSRICCAIFCRFLYTFSTTDARVRVIKSGRAPLLNVYMAVRRVKQ